MNKVLVYEQYKNKISLLRPGIGVTLPFYTFQIITLKRTERLILLSHDLTDPVPEEFLDCLSSTLGLTAKVLPRDKSQCPTNGCISLPIEANILFTYLP